MACVLVTGAAGFVGSHLLELLAHDGADLVAWQRPGTEPLVAGNGVRWTTVEMLDRDAVRAALRSLQPEMIYHLAGLPHVGDSWGKTRDTFDKRNKLVSLVQYVMNKKGPGTSPVAESGGFLSTTPGLAAPDIQLHFLPVLVVDHGRTKIRDKSGYSLHVCTLRPESAGTIRLRSTNPGEHPLIDANYLAERKDLDSLIAGVKMGRDILAQSGLDPYRADEFQPGAAAKTDAEIEQWIRGHCETIYHPVGTCKMGPSTDRMAVVDDKLLVHGVEGLRVVDASVMPTLVGGNTNAPTIMIAERTAAIMHAAGLTN